jgi:hypothetical protein
VWVLAVELLAPVLGEDLRLGEAGELLEVQQLVADAGVEGLRERVGLRCRLRLIGRVRRELFV